jgi:probable HAF family extracellular repeat protein
MILDFGLPYAYQTRAYRWQDGVIQDLGTLGGPDAMALGINEHGQIIGNSYTGLDPSPVCGLTTGAFLWQHGIMINLGSLGGTCTQVSAINNRGQVVGNSSLPGDNAFHPFLWEHGKLRDLGTKGGNFASPLVMNDDGDAAGWASLPGDDNIIHATLWTGERVIDLGSLGPGQCSIAFGINSQKQVVGLSGNCDFDDPSLRAFIWEPGESMVDLNALIALGLGVQLRTVAAINDRGEMAAVGWFDDDTHRPVLLFPCGKQREDCGDVVSAVHQTNRSLATPAVRSRYTIMTAWPSALSQWRKRIAGERTSIRWQTLR